ncbi:MAG: hypothetical protein R2939_17910 [Kofleriaceae bacterium]
MTGPGKHVATGLTRRALLGVGGAGVAALAVSRLARGQDTPPPPGLGCAPAPTVAPAISLADIGGGPDRTRFLAWLRRHGVARDRAVRNLVYNFYDVPKAEGSWLYPMLAGKTILWMVQGGQVDEAVAIADTLVRWQQTDRTDKRALSYGAFPSMVEPGELPGEYAAGSRYYAGDNLVILEALLALHARTGTRAYLDAAVGIGTWLTDVMCAGHKHGVWAEDHGAPMAFVTATGDFSNAIQTAVELLWIGALGRLGRATRRPRTVARPSTRCGSTWAPRPRRARSWITTTPGTRRCPTIPAAGNSSTAARSSPTTCCAARSGCAAPVSSGARARCTRGCRSSPAAASPRPSTWRPARPGSPRDRRSITTSRRRRCTAAWRSGSASARRSRATWRC